jgi:drug/metabolite transporter (DMT)-like permease
MMLVCLAMIWGSSFTFIKIALSTLTPLTIAAGRIGLAAIILVLIALVRKETWPRDTATWGWLFALALLGNAVPFFLISWGEHHVDGGMTAVLMSVIPLTVPIMAHFITDDEKLSPQMLIGVVVGFCGLLVLVGPSALSGIGDDLISQGAIVFAALCYGSAAFVARKLSSLPRMIIAAGSISIAAVIMVPMALIVDQPWTFHADLKSLGALVYLGIFPTALANILLLQVIKTSGVSFLALNNYLVPVFGVLIATLALGETVPPEMLTSLGIIFVGIFISSYKRKNG